MIKVQFIGGPKHGQIAQHKTKRWLIDGRRITVPNINAIQSWSGDSYLSFEPHGGSLVYEYQSTVDGHYLLLYKEYKYEKLEPVKS